MAMMRCFSAAPSRGAAPGRCLSWERPLEASLSIAPANLPHRLGGELNLAGHLGGRLAGVELQQSQRPQHGAHGLDSLPQQLAEFFAVGLGEANGETTIGAHGLL